MEASDLRWMRELEYKNARLKRMFADLSLENRALKDVIEKSSEASREARISLLPSRRVWFEHHEDLHRVTAEPQSLSGYSSERYAGGYGAT